MTVQNNERKLPVRVIWQYIDLEFWPSYIPLDGFWLFGCSLTVAVYLDFHGCPLIFDNKFVNQPCSWLKYKTTTTKFLIRNKGQIFNGYNVKGCFFKAQKALLIEKSLALSKHLAAGLVSEHIREILAGTPKGRFAPNCYAKGAGMQLQCVGAAVRISLNVCMGVLKKTVVFFSWKQKSVYA